MTFGGALFGDLGYSIFGGVLALNAFCKGSWSPPWCVIPSKMLRPSEPSKLCEWTSGWLTASWLHAGIMVATVSHRPRPLVDTSCVLLSLCIRKAIGSFRFGKWMQIVFLLVFHCCCYLLLLLLLLMLPFLLLSLSLLLLLWCCGEQTESLPTDGDKSSTGKVFLEDIGSPPLETSTREPVVNISDHT